jgi:signal transduction histidine kinase
MIGLLSADGKLLEFFSCGFCEEEDAVLRRAPRFVEELIQAIQRRPGPTRSTIADCGLRIADCPANPQSAIRNLQFLGVPLAGPGRCRGALCLLRPPELPAFGPEDEETVLPLGAWLEEGNLFEEARLLTQIRLLNQIAQAAAGNLDVAHMFRTTLRELDRHLPLHVSAVWLVPEAGNREQGTADRDGGAALPPEVVLADASPGCAELGLAPGLRWPLEPTSFAGCVRDGQAVYVDLAAAREAGGEEPALSPVPCPLSSMLAARGVNSWFAVPLRAGDRVVGILQSVCTRPTGFTNEQIQLLYLAADLLGPAISNGQLFDQLRKAYEELRLTQGQLIQAEKMRALGELAGGMAHEFNNSLCGVLGFLELALWDKALAAGSRGYLESARTCALDAAQTVRRVQDFARQRRHDLPVQVLDVNDLVHQTVELARHKWESLDRTLGAPVTVAVQAEARARVCGQPTELREVLTNLLFNAVDAMPQGGTLTVRCWSSGADVFLAVQDTGVGIREADRRRLFEPFFTTKGERGNGLGLSVTFGIVHRHGGDITVESQVGWGSTFTVRLPAGQEGAAAARAAAETPAAAGTRSLRILVVDDEESIRRFLGACLTRLGHRPHLATDGDEALAALAADRFDLVLTDLGLPGISGEEVARTVAQRTPGVPVVLLTGWADQLGAEMIQPEGVTRILSKPVTINTLSTTLTEVMGW